MRGATPDTAADALFWGALLILGFVLVGATAYGLRRWLLRPPEVDASPGWSLQHLRDLHARGQITEDEFESLRKQYLAKHGAAEASKNADSTRAAQE